MIKARSPLLGFSHGVAGIGYALAEIGTVTGEERFLLVENPVAAERFSSELSRLLFWIHQASGSIALGVLTLAAGAALIGYFGSALAWRSWLSSRWRQRRHARREVV